MENAPITDEDLRAALLEMKTYMDITQEDLMKIYGIALKHAKERLAAKVSVSEVMTRAVITVKRDTNIQEAAGLLADHKISGLPVVDQENRVVGMVTEADILTLAGMKKEHFLKDIVRYLLGEPLPQPKAGNKVEDFMTSPAITTKPETDVKEVARILTERRIKRLPVVNDEYKLVGIISRADILKVMGER